MKQTKKSGKGIKALQKTLVYKLALPFLFKICSIAPLRQNTALFASYLFCELPDNMRMVYDEMKRRGISVKTVLKPPGEKPLGSREALKLFLRFTALFARAAYIIVDDYFPPLYCNKPRKNQKIVQLWHGAGAFKKWGYSTADNGWGQDAAELARFPIHGNYTHVAVSSAEVIPHYAEAFGLSEHRIHAWGFPRSDVFFDGDYLKRAKEKLTELLPQSRGKKILLYAPTFRGVSGYEAYNENRLDIARMKKSLGGGYFLITKLHPFVSRGMIHDADSDFAADVTKTMEISEALCCADLLISDYSSLVFEYSLLNRPMVFYAYDLEEYTGQRDFYYPYEDFVPGPIVPDNDTLIAAIKETENGFDAGSVRAFREKFMSACDGHSTERVVNMILSKDTKGSLS